VVVDVKNNSKDNPLGESSVTMAYRRIALEMVGQQKSTGLYRLKIISNSMAPMLRPGDVVTVLPMNPGESVQRGDIIVFWQSAAQDQGIPLTHRLIASTSSGWLTKGDFRLLPDTPLRPEALLGRVIAFQHGPRQVDLERPAWQFVNRLLGWFHFGLGRLMSGAHRIRRLLVRR
jgi:signal peptidase I